jgi:hypothetical protein
VSEIDAFDDRVQACVRIASNGEVAWKGEFLALMGAASRGNYSPARGLIRGGEEGGFSQSWEKGFCQIWQTAARSADGSGVSLRSGG